MLSTDNYLIGDKLTISMKIRIVNCFKFKKFGCTQDFGYADTPSITLLMSWLSSPRGVAALLSWLCVVMFLLTFLLSSSGNV